MSEVISVSKSVLHAPPEVNHNAAWLPVVLLSVWLAMEIGRPTYPLKIPLLCSITLLGYWVFLPRKRWDPIIVCIIGFLATGWFGVLFSANQYSAFWTSYALSITTGCIAIPAAHFIKNIRQIHLFVGTFLAVTAYVGLFAITHAGFGPAGASGGQDENYVAAAMSAALPFAYFSLSATKSKTIRLLLLGLSVICLLATVVGLSRGGFLGVGAAALFCFWFSPRKLVAIFSAIVGLGAVVAVAPDSYWVEIESIGDTSEGTADMRLELWAVATRQFLDNPVLGVGPGNFRWRIEEYQTDEQIEKMGRSLGGSAITHSTYFEILSELGGLGSGFFLFMLYFTSKELRWVVQYCQQAAEQRRLHNMGRSRLDQDLESLHAYAMAIAGGLIGYLVCSMFLSTTYYSTIWMFCALTVAIRHVLADLIASIEDTLDNTLSSSISNTLINPDRDIQQPEYSSAQFAEDPPPSNPPPRLSDLLGE